MIRRTTFSRLAGAGAAVAALSLALAACSSSSGADSGSDSGSGGIALGYTATLTGDFASYGLEMREGVDLAVEQLNEAGGIDGKEVSIVSADDEGSPANGPVVAQQFCDDTSTAAVLGYSFSSVALAALPVYDQCGLPVVASAVTSPELSGASDVFFRDVFTDAYQGAEMGTHVHDGGVEKIAVLYQQDDYGQGVADSFTSAFEEAGGEVTSSQAYQLGAVDFATAINTALADSPDGIFIGGFYTEAAAIAQQLRTSGSELPIFGTDGAVSPDLTSLGGDAVEGMTVYSAFTAAAGTPASADFVEAFTEKYGKAPSSWAALAYDATNVVAQAITDAGSTDRAAVTEALAATEGFDGVTGDISFDDGGDRLGELIFLKVEDGEFVAE
ncbi:ABC transporter substrate-binding protein [Herbiconiux sp. KACC 21604]|uniref:ABC transporter substrate-binding protein n=1 Tax=unclassified Herbiconiux TaxID=2618217 RepID=UPI0014911D39|nr:ABC transporter substrate-binding protein [Herbiconiux sp. SALV-R1]QJU55179.1 ABC transporter substrate-binding protein [Herbiconiux sp. SALV-R1]WPO86340.1 ABC transporter substrate-binding protein [Herbiconiux sp. KACC 21604]